MRASRCNYFGDLNNPICRPEPVSTNDPMQMQMQMQFQQQMQQMMQQQAAMMGGAANASSGSGGGAGSGITMMPSVAPTSSVSLAAAANLAATNAAKVASMEARCEELNRALAAKEAEAAELRLEVARAKQAQSDAFSEAQKAFEAKAKVSDLKTVARGVGRTVNDRAKAPFQSILFIACTSRHFNSVFFVYPIFFSCVHISYCFGDESFRNSLENMMTTFGA